tara:strand:+ start:679 stop:879 length:201 start_codon:yes stop_codon:yes gene_type:complete
MKKQSTIIKDNYSRNDDFTVNGILISILGKTSGGNIQFEHSKNGTDWSFETASPIYDLKYLQEKYL